MDILIRLRELMDARGWSEYKLAKMSGLSNAAISNLFRKNNAPTISTLESICSGFGISLSQFFSDGTEPVELNEEQRMLFEKWLLLTAEQKEVIMTIIKEL